MQRPPPHRGNSGRSGWSQDPAYGSRAPSNITPGADNFGAGAAGGLAGIATTVADRNARESGLNAMRGTEDYGHHGYGDQQYSQPQPPVSPYIQSPYNQSQFGYDHGYEHGYDQGGYDHSPNLRPDTQSGHGPYHDSSPGLAPMGAAAFSSGHGTSARSQHSYGSDPFEDPHFVYGQRMEPGLGQVNPHDIMDDGDDGLHYGRPARNSMLSLGNVSDRGNNGKAVAAGAAGGAAAGGVMGGLMGRNQNSYGPVSDNTAYQGASSSAYDLGTSAAKEKSDRLAREAAHRRRRKWWIIFAIGLIVVAGVAGGVAGGLLSKKASSSTSSTGANSSNGGGESASQDTQDNGDLDINSSQIQALMNNANLHKVFPGVDYTPLNTQYPDCLTNPPSQNNITRDVAVLSQLTNKIRLYGTDCNQTEMTIHALKQLKLDSEIKIWMGVWQDNNATTNARQLSQMWSILDTYGDTPFEGLIVANEILFREQMTVAELGTLLASVRTNLTSKGMSLPVATSDLGDKWTAELAAQSDLVMANIHPFFGGIAAEDAAGWAYSFWENQNSPFFKSTLSNNVISEIGWPSQGGTDCGSATTCTNGAVAGIDNLNTLMADWVCQALTNGTNYFWFEMFDEPWKLSFDEPGKEWEDHWGLMDVDRNLKTGVKIPDCGGKTVA